MESLQLKTTLSSLTEIKIPDDLKEKIQLNQEVRVLLIPEGNVFMRNGTTMNGINYH
jgi:hypothetical protein